MDLDHFNIRTTKLEETVRFYGELLGLTSGPRPEQPLNGSWLYSGSRAVIHLLESRSTAKVTGPLDHVAFFGSGLSDFLHRLDTAGIPRVARAIPGTPMVQVQFLDPNGVLVEANFSDELLDCPSASLEIDAHQYLALAQRDTRRLLLISGAEAADEEFAALIPILERHFSVRTYDATTGSKGGSLRESFTLADQADEAAALIASLGSCAHVWGHAEGSIVAQELAARHPHCVGNLVLGTVMQRDTPLPHRRALPDERLAGIQACTLVTGRLDQSVADSTASCNLARAIPNATLMMLKSGGRARARDALGTLGAAVVNFLLRGVPHEA